MLMVPVTQDIKKVYLIDPPRFSECYKNRPNEDLRDRYHFSVGIGISSS